MHAVNVHTALHEELLHMIQGHVHTQAIYVMATLGIADLLAGGPKSSDELAQLAQVNASALYRVLRLLAASGVLEETEQHTFSLTPLGTCLQRDVPGSLHSTAVLEGGETVWPLLGHLLYSVQTGKSAQQKALGIDARQYFKQYLNAPFFNEHLATQALRLASALATTYDFQHMSTLVDVGGKEGQALTTLLQVYPTLRGVLFDVPEVIEHARRFMCHTEVTERCELIGGNFLVAVPSGCDGYLLSRVLHDWNDEQTITILQNCHRAMREGGKLLILERVILNAGCPDLRTLRSDIQMLLISESGGLERSETEYQTLLTAASFAFVQTIPIHPPYFLIEAVRLS